MNSQLKISLDISLFNLTNKHKEVVKQFITQLENSADSSFIVKQTPLSIQVYGDYLPIMQFATQEFKKLFQQEPITGLTVRLGTCPFATD